MTREEAIMAVRQKIRSGEFDRAIVKITPDDVFWDECTLECGHSTQHTEEYGDQPSAPPTRAICRSCAETWVRANTSNEHINSRLVHR